MKKILITALIAMSYIGSANAEFYTVDIKRVDTKTAIINKNIPIEWQFSCFEIWAGTEEAILKYDRYSFDNYVLFDNGQKCDLKYGQ